MTRKSVPTHKMLEWWAVGWAYLMPDFDHPNHSIIEWRSDKAPVEPRRVPINNNQETAHDHDRPQ